MTASGGSGRQIVRFDARCQSCGADLDEDDGDDATATQCSSCRGKSVFSGMLGASPGPAANDAAPAFSSAEMSLISKMHRYMGAEKLLSLVNERRACDRPGSVLHTMQQLAATIQRLADADAVHQMQAPTDFASMRKLLATARRAGVLARVTEQVIADFAIVYCVTPKQVLVLKDIVLAAAQEDAE